MYIHKDEVLRYLGYRHQNIDENLDRLIDTCIEETKQCVQCKYVIKVFDIEKGDEHIEILGSRLIFKGKDIINHLEDSSTCAIMAVTLGNHIENKIKLYEKTNLTKAVILDACATTAVESLCDEVQKEIKKQANSRNLGITHRYSPGYGDFSIDIQPMILDTLEAYKKIGLTCTKEKILIPRKSVTAIIGFKDNNITTKHSSCKECSKYRDCTFKREENFCGN
ncbi:vitamin B12 dependent-methionine synthase activation domain-containing protein [Inediibacterium massiliense]|uniref:vitamin B12 dependent-methionine synthase activation domain-containing protein n=1 Tax=Inediibacterium massiliense TaxID=1658111 RepID=UPI0006B5501F|nr:vitamin B12 dependent-methionine synthase activation domain-containing protein [Inediibacterium massiliense]